MHVMSCLIYIHIQVRILISHISTEDMVPEDYPRGYKVHLNGLEVKGGEAGETSAIHATPSTLPSLSTIDGKEDKKDKTGQEEVEVRDGSDMEVVTVEVGDVSEVAIARSTHKRRQEEAFEVQVHDFVDINNSTKHDDDVEVTHVSKKDRV